MQLKELSCTAKNLQGCTLHWLMLSRRYSLSKVYNYVDVSGLTSLVSYINWELCYTLQVTVEIPYLLVQALTYVVITYPMIGYQVSAYKIFWYFYGMFTTLLYYNYLGMVLVALTPNFLIAATLCSVFYIMFNLFAGFVIPQPVS